VAISRAHFLLWEAEWMTVPSDPILLRHFGRNLYAVMAQSDLTPVGQAILRARRRQWLSAGGSTGTAGARDDTRRVRCRR